MYMANRALEGTLFGSLAAPAGCGPAADACSGPAAANACGFAVAHCNFRLRGAESDGDEQFVRSWCSSHGVQLFCTAFDTAEYAAAHGISIEMAARELRYGWFAQICAAHGFDALAVAHNADDNAETLLLNLLRGTGSRGLRGMAASSESPAEPASSSSAGCPLRILRPMLGISRKEISAWMTARGLEWREDSSNSSDAYKRNILRHKVLPAFEEINPSYLGTLARDMRNFAQVDDIAEEYYRAALPLVRDSKGIRITPLLAHRHWRYLLWRLLEPYSLNAETFDKLCALLERYSAEPRGTVTISGKTFQSSTHTLRICRTTLLAQQK